MHPPWNDPPKRRNSPIQQSRLKARVVQTDKRRNDLEQISQLAIDSNNIRIRQVNPQIVMAKGRNISSLFHHQPFGVMGAKVPLLSPFSEFGSCQSTRVPISRPDDSA